MLFANKYIAIKFAIKRKLADKCVGKRRICYFLITTSNTSAIRLILKTIKTRTSFTNFIYSYLYNLNSHTLLAKETYDKNRSNQIKVY